MNFLWDWKWADAMMEIAQLTEECSLYILPDNVLHTSTSRWYSSCRCGSSVNMLQLLTPLLHTLCYKINARLCFHLSFACPGALAESICIISCIVHYFYVKYRDLEHIYQSWQPLSRTQTLSSDTWDGCWHASHLIPLREISRLKYLDGRFYGITAIVTAARS